MAFIELDTRHYPRHERVDAVQDTCAAIAHLDIQVPARGRASAELDMRMRMRVLPGVSIGYAEGAAWCAQRSTRHIAHDGADNLALWLNPGNAPGCGWVAHQHGSEMPSTRSLGYLVQYGLPGDVHMHGARGRFLCLSFPQLPLSQLSDVDRALRQPLPDSLPLRLLIRQAQELLHRGPGGTNLSDAQRLSLSRQLQDLALLALGGKPDARAAARAGGLRQARLDAIKADLRVNAGRSDLSLEQIAARHRVSPQYVRALFAHEHSSFSDYLLEQRLQRALARLCNPRHAHCTVDAIAYDAGFNNPSWFYRAFKRRFAMTPSDARQRARQAAT